MGQLAQAPGEDIVPTLFEYFSFHQGCELISHEALMNQGQNAKMNKSFYYCWAFS